MNYSVFDIFTIGIGPSSSHTVGPMKAATSFVKKLINKNLFESTTRIHCDFFGSLALTGKGHGTDKAFILGVQGHDPETINSNYIPEYIAETIKKKKAFLNFGSTSKTIDFNPKKDIKFNRRKSLPFHPNAMTIYAFNSEDEVLYQHTYYSIGGGTILENEEKPPRLHEINSFASADELLSLVKTEPISQFILKNECELNSEDHILNKLQLIWNTMEKSIQNGINNEGILPGGLQVKRRAPDLYKKLQATIDSDYLDVLDWVNLYAIAVNEENANGGQVVTAPTNGAAGIIPAVIMYYKNFSNKFRPGGIEKFLLTAGAIAMLYKKNASISGAEVGCQGEVGVACSMAAGALCEVMGGTPMQVENAAEIAMEHHLGMTCDPIGGLVQIPCIERNAMGAVKAINAAKMALRGDGVHYVSLDKVIRTMMKTGQDMKRHYKETSKGGLAVNLPEC